MFNKIKELFFHNDKEIKSNRWIFITILITAILGLIAAFVLSVEAVELAKNPNAHLGCSINVIINCATVANSKYSALLGFPNSFIGLIGETVFVVIAVAMLMGAKFTKKFMFCAQLAAVFALIFAFGLFYISSFIIHALCPWCMLVLLSTTIMFFAISRYNIRENNLYLPANVSNQANDFIKNDYDKLTLGIIIVLVTVFIIIRYGNGLFI